MTTRYVRAANVLHRNAGPDVVAMLPEDEDVHVLSGPAAPLWDLLAESRDRDELIGGIADLYERSPEDVREAMEGCLGELVARGVIEEHDA